MKCCILLATAAMVVATASEAQQIGATSPDVAASAPLAELQIASTSQTRFSGLNIGHVRCDEKGNLYLRPYNSEMAISHSVLKGPIQKIDSDGNIVTTYSVSDAVPNSSGGVAGVAFFVSGDGTLYRIVATNERKPTLYILKFGQDGSVDSAIHLQTDFFVPYQLAVFKSGELLVSGGLGEKQIEAFTGIFDSTGKLIRKISNSEDEESTKKVQVDASLTFQGSGFISSALASGDVAPGSDGNMYLMRASSPAVIFAISPAGEVVKTFKVDSGDPQFTAITLRSAPGRLAVSFRRDQSPELFIKVVDFEGNVLAAYHANDRRLRAPFVACYVPPAFTFFEANSRGPATLDKVEAK
jgi:hypothetical protein